MFNSFRVTITTNLRLLLHMSSYAHTMLYTAASTQLCARVGKGAHNKHSTQQALFARNNIIARSSALTLGCMLGYR